jgi:hypothetical protein
MMQFDNTILEKIIILFSNIELNTVTILSTGVVISGVIILLSGPVKKGMELAVKIGQIAAAANVVGIGINIDFGTKLIKPATTPEALKTSTTKTKFL